MTDNNTDTGLNDLSNIVPWNSKQYPVKVNSIRYNQDYTLLTLGTTKGYKIFLTDSLKLCHEETDVVKNLGDINIAMTYYKSSIVLFLPNKDNQNFSNKEIILFDDFYQLKKASFKEKKEEIVNFSISKNLVFIMTLSKIIILEIFSFKIIEIIENINPSNKLLSFNFIDFIAYIKFDNKKNIYINHYLNENHKIVSQTKKMINSPFEFIQNIQLSPSGLLIGLVSIYGNKIHIYYTQTGKLKECIFLGPNIQTTEKMSFSKKENYVLLQKNNYKFFIYKIGKSHDENPKCVCDKYDDKNLISSNENKTKKKSNGFFGLFKKSSKTKDIKNPHTFGEYNGQLLFFDFDKNINKNKDIILIDYKGKFNRYHFDKKKSENVSPTLSVQWI